jgi:hypothetical protein
LWLSFRPAAPPPPPPQPLCIYKILFNKVNLISYSFMGEISPKSETQNNNNKLNHQIQYN